MKKVIKNRVYDTATAVKVAEYSSPGDWGDFGHYEERLYRKKVGEYFLHGEGGPMTRYAVSTGLNSWSGGEKIIPLDYAAAQEWAEEHLDEDEYERIFGAVVEDDRKQQITLMLFSSTAEKLRRESSKTGEPISDIIDRLVAEGIK